MSDYLKDIKEQIEKNKIHHPSSVVGEYKNEDIANLMEHVKQLVEQNYHYREAIVEAMDLGLYGDSDDGIMTMYDILNRALGSESKY